MDKLAINNPKRNTSLTILQDSVVRASKTGDRIDSIPQRELETFLKEVMVMIGAGEGNIPTNEMFLYLAKTMPLVLGKWTLAEIRHAIILTLKGTLTYNLNLYGKPFNLMFISNLMKEYEALKRDSVIQNRRTAPMPQDAPTDEERNDMMREYALNSYNNHCQNIATFNDYSTALYDYYDRLGLINFSPKKRAEFDALALDLTEKSMELEAARTTRSERKVLKMMLQSLDPDNNIVQAKAKELAIRAFYNNLARGNQSLEGML